MRDEAQTATTTPAVVPYFPDTGPLQAQGTTLAFIGVVLIVIGTTLFLQRKKKHDSGH